MRPIGIVYILKEPDPKISLEVHNNDAGVEKMPSMHTLVVLPFKYEMYHFRAVPFRSISLATLFTKTLLLHHLHHVVERGREVK